MKRTAILVTSLVGVAGVLAVGAVLTGVVPLLGNGDSGRPPCEQLPTLDEVTAAMDRNAALVNEIRQVGEGVSVEVATPCDDPDLALVSIRYQARSEQEGVHTILRDGDGFGVPAELVKG